MSAGWLRLVVVMALFAVATPPAGAAECADVYTGSGSGTSAGASTSDGYEVRVTALGQTVEAEALRHDCINAFSAKSSKMVVKTIEDALKEAPPLP